ncbi:hypothetical protein LK549_004618 [Salmonella enterica]|uniref:hypothetical protein n=1 Tax=Salmonella enterica TaxID=28901 RepID=UPI001CDE5901|nr:hypothetical protein [Salmonella enterica]HBJ6845994.1 hypothetical protein [Salmonella enterica subsp. diarizonae serovar 48:i:z]HCM2451975.1 hypothetical protein [Salmonella enterica subsp. enterica serovar Muenchen]EIF8866671.1 hypothetical protein [Salmonella enterica]EII9568111.1 hypothetical protein [Salmonella enterica]
MKKINAETAAYSVSEKGEKDGLTLNQLAERNAEYVTEISRLKARCAALASDNAALKYQEPTLTAMMSCLEAFYADEDVPERAMMGGYNILRKSVNTPATDAFLDEVRTQARNELITELESRFNQMTETLPVELRSGAAGAAAFVSAFRKGAAL